jgi:hypothetical protein
VPHAPSRLQSRPDTPKNAPRCHPIAASPSKPPALRIKPIADSQPKAGDGKVTQYD